MMVTNQPVCSLIDADMFIMVRGNFAIFLWSNSSFQPACPFSKDERSLLLICSVNVASRILKGLSSIFLNLLLNLFSFLLEFLFDESVHERKSAFRHFLVGVRRLPFCAVSCPFLINHWLPSRLIGQRMICLPCLQFSLLCQLQEAE